MSARQRAAALARGGLNGVREGSAHYAAFLAWRAADAYLIHPVDPDVLLATLRTLLRARRSEEALREAEARFGEIFRQINAPIAVLNADLSVRGIESGGTELRIVIRPGGSTRS